MIMRKVFCLSVFALCISSALAQDNPRAAKTSTTPAASQEPVQVDTRKAVNVKDTASANQKPSHAVKTGTRVVKTKPEERKKK